MQAGSPAWRARRRWARRTRAAALVAIVLSTLFFGGAALGAPTKEPEGAAGKAAKELAARNYRGAAEAYEAAFKEAPNPKWLLNAAHAWKHEGENARAANALSRYLKALPDKAPQRAAAKKELAALAPKLGQLGIKAEGASVVSVDGVEWDPADATLLYVAPGPHLVEARFPDESVTASPTARAGAVEPVTIARTAPAAPPVVAAPPPPPARVDDETAKPAARQKPLPPLAVYIGGGVAVVAGGLALVSGLDTQSQREEFDKNPTQENLDAGKGKQLRTNVLLAVSGVAIAATAVAAIWFVDWGSKRASAKVGAGLGTVWLRGTF